jgi:2-hydroxycyclohexanecarboxyl-CoA dehydrogenase
VARIPEGIALVTGAGSGIGRATAELLSARGYLIAVNDADATSAHEVAELVGGVSAPADVADGEAVAALVARLEAAHGAVAVAVCNAGVSGSRPLAEITDEVWRTTLRVNLGGCFNVARAVVPGMQRRRAGAIITIASELALTGAAGLVHYVSSKAAVIGFTRSLARELAPHRVRANCIAPGPTDTPLLGAFYRSEQYLATIPLGRLGTPAEVAEAIVFMAQAEWITGQVLSPNGGAVIQ